MKLFNISEKEPPKDKPFLALTDRGLEMMEWSESVIGDENPGWYGFYRPCGCCDGYCGSVFDLWMPMPEIPKKDHIRF